MVKILIIIIEGNWDLLVLLCKREITLGLFDFGFVMIDDAISRLDF